MIYKTIGLLFLFAGGAGAAPTNYVGLVTAQIDALVTGGVPPLLAIGNTVLTWVAVIMLTIYGLRWAIHSASRHHPEFPFAELIHFFGLFLVAELMMRFYNVPLPMIGASFHQILPKIGNDIASHISLASLDTLVGQIAAIINPTTGISKPSILNPVEVFVFVGILCDMALIEGILFGVTVLGFVAVGIGSVVGPLFIPFLLVPRVSWLFWNWFSFMLQYSFYPVVASGLVFVWTNVLVGFITNSVNHNYSLANFLFLLVPLGMLNIGMFISIAKVTSFTSDLFKGVASSGAGMVSSFAGAMRGAFA